MVTKKLFLSDSSSEEDKSSSPPIVVPITKETKVSTNEEEESFGEDSDSYSSDEESYPPKTSVVVPEEKEEEKENSEEDESSSEEDEESFPPLAATLVVPTDAKETNVPTNEEKEEESSEASSEEKENMVQKKRKSEGVSSGDLKDAKQAKTDEKKMLFQRIWSSQDEMIMLQGIIDFKSNTGKTINEDKNGFYEFIKKSISSEVTFSQCIGKIGSIRRKYMSKAAKGMKPSWNAHDFKTFELSEQIWGSVVAGKDGAEESGKSKIIIDVEKDKDEVGLEQGDEWFNRVAGWVANHGLKEDYVKRMWARVSAEKKKEMHVRWTILHNKDAETLTQKSEYVNDVVSLISDAAKSSSH